MAYWLANWSQYHPSLKVIVLYCSQYEQSRPIYKKSSFTCSTVHLSPPKAASQSFHTASHPSRLITSATSAGRPPPPSPRAQDKALAMTARQERAGQTGKNFYFRLACMMASCLAVCDLLHFVQRLRRWRKSSDLIANLLKAFSVTSSLTIGIPHSWQRSSLARDLNGEISTSRSSL